MATPSELAQAERATIAGVPEPWRYRNGNPPTMRPQPAAEPGGLSLEELREKRDVYHNLSISEFQLLATLEREQREREDAELVPFWKEQKRVAAEELRQRRESGYRSELDNIAESNTQVATLTAKIQALTERLFDAKQKTLLQPRDIEEILTFAAELPVLEKAIPLLEAELSRCESSVHEWTAHSEGIARRIHEDLELRIRDWRDLRVSELRPKIHGDLLNMFTSEPAPELLDGILKDSPEYRALQSPVTLPDKDSVNVDEWQTAIKQVEMLTVSQETQVETAPIAVAECPEETNRTKRRSR